jgi:hypothetical protein
VFNSTPTYEFVYETRAERFRQAIEPPQERVRRPWHVGKRLRRATRRLPGPVRSVLIAVRDRLRRR